MHLSAFSQTSVYSSTRDWVIGHYSGTYKDSTANGPWQPIAFEIDYSSYHPFYWNDDTTVYVGIGIVYYKISLDSVFLSPGGFISPNNTGKLYKNDSLLFKILNPGPNPHFYYYKLKKMSSTFGIKERQRSSTIQIIPNPAQNYIQVSLPELFGEVFTYKIYNSSGQLIESSDLNDTQRIDISILPNGIYYLGFYGKWNQYNSIFIKE
jgi:hypothetical protein